LGTGHFLRWADGKKRLAALHSHTRLGRLRVPLAVPQPQPKPDRGRVVLVNVNIVAEVMNRNDTTSRIFPSSGYICEAADALRPALTLPPEQVTGSGAFHHAAAQPPDHGGKRCRFSMHRTDHSIRSVILQRCAASAGLPACGIALGWTASCAILPPALFHGMA